MADSKDLDRLDAAVEKLADAISELKQLFVQASTTSKHRDEAVARNLAMIEAMRGRVETLEQWKAGAMVKLAAIVFAGAVVATGLLQQIVSKPAPAPVIVQPATHPAPASHP